MNALAMPSLAGIPRHIEHRRGGSFAARLALALDARGLFPASDWDTDAHGDVQLVQRALKRWWARRFDGLEVLQAGLHIHETRSSMYATAETGEMVLTAWASQNPHPSDRARQLRPVCEALERRVPGLAETAIAWLYDGLRTCGLDCLTPRWALYAASFSWWHGEFDEQMVLEEAMAEGENPEELDIYRRADFFRVMPPWAAEPKKRLSRKRLELLAPREPVAAACLAVAASIRTSRITSLWHVMERVDDVETCGVAALILWSPEDDCLRLCDDYSNEVVNGGGEDALFAFRVEPQPEPLAEALQKIDRALAVARAVDALALLITSPLRF